MAVEAAGTGVLPLETDERLSVADDMDMVNMGLKGCGEKLCVDSDCLGTVENSPECSSGTDAGTFLGLTKLCCWDALSRLVIERCCCARR